MGFKTDPDRIFDLRTLVVLYRAVLDVAPQTCHLTMLPARSLPSFVRTTAVVLFILNPFLVCSYQDSDFLIGVESSARYPRKLLPRGDEDLLQLYDEEDDEKVQSNRPVQRKNRLEGIVEYVLGNNKLGLNPRMVMSFGAAALLSLLKQKLDASSRRPKQTTPAEKNWKTLYESLVAKTEVDRASLASQLHRSKEVAAHWESVATDAEAAREKVQSDLEVSRNETERLGAEASREKRALETELKQVKECLRNDAEPGDESLRIELERAKKLLFKMKSNKEKAAVETKEQLDMAETERRAIEAQAQTVKQSLEADLAKAKERSSYWEARSKQEQAQHSRLISQLCQEMKTIMVEEKQRLQQEFQKEADELRQQFVSGLGTT